MEIEILYEDNHIIAINKRSSQIVQGDKTGDESLIDTIKAYIKRRDAKQGNVFLGLVHRLDRPVSGIIIFAKTSKALSRMNELFRNKDITKIYWAIVKGNPPDYDGMLMHYLTRNEKQNKSYAHDKPVKDAKEARLQYTIICNSDKYTLLQIKLFTGRHHQIRCQLAKIGLPVKGDLKYGAERSNPDGSISLHARSIEFIHPVKNEAVKIVAPAPHDTLWQYFESIN